MQNESPIGYEFKYFQALKLSVSFMKALDLDPTKPVAKNDVGIKEFSFCEGFFQQTVEAWIMMG